MTEDAPTLEEIYGAPYGVELIGPNTCGHYTVSVDGYKVPNLLVYKRPDTDTEWTVRLDGRFEYDMDDHTLRASMSLVANAMAIAAGYSAFGENCIPANPYKTKIGFMSYDEVTQRLPGHPARPGGYDDYIV